MRLRPAPKIKVSFRTVHTEEYQGMELLYLGKVIGTCSGWDEGGSQELCFYNYIPNELGKKFIDPHIDIHPARYDSITIGTETGDVSLYYKSSSWEKIEVDWSVFNREKGETTDKK